MRTVKAGLGRNVYIYWHTLTISMQGNAHVFLKACMHLYCVYKPRYHLLQKEFSVEEDLQELTSLFCNLMEAAN